MGLHLNPDDFPPDLLAQATIRGVDRAALGGDGASGGGAASRPAGGRRKSKYGNRKVIVDGVTFDSQREVDEWIKLRALESAGRIRDLRRQVPFVLTADGADGVPFEVERYVADFVYVDVETGLTVVVDAKGYRTRDYRRKKRWMLKVYGIDIAEV